MDIVRSLQRLNRFIEDNKERRMELFRNNVGYYMSTIALVGMEGCIDLNRSGKNCKELLMAMWTISFAWSCLLAGDIADIPQEIEHTKIAKDYNLS